MLLLTVVKLGEACEEDIQCSKGEPGSICVESQCVCSERYSLVEGHCVPKTSKHVVFLLHLFLLYK